VFVGIGSHLSRKTGQAMMSVEPKSALRRPDRNARCAHKDGQRYAVLYVRFENIEAPHGFIPDPFPRITFAPTPVR
jgi:hypothetical protein